MIDMAMPMKLAVILLRSAKTTQLFDLTQVNSSDFFFFFQKKKTKERKPVVGLTECVPLVLPYCLRQIDWQISGQR